jgi:hypothetical protein
MGDVFLPSDEGYQSGVEGARCHGGRFQQQQQRPLSNGQVEMCCQLQAGGGVQVEPTPAQTQQRHGGGHAEEWAGTLLQCCCKLVTMLQCSVPWLQCRRMEQTLCSVQMLISEEARWCT